MKRWLFYPERPQTLALVRIVMMSCALLFLSRDLVQYESQLATPSPFQLKGIFMLLPFPLGNGSLRALHALWIVSCFTALIGYRTRFFLFLAFFSGLFVHGYGYNFTRTYHHSQTYLQLILVLALTPCAAAWSLEARFRKAPPPSDRFSWGLRLGQFVVVLFYTATGVAKLLRSGWEWAFSESAAYWLAMSPERTLLGDWLLRQPPFLLRALALGVLCVELFSPLALLSRRLSFVFLGAWTLMHVGIYATMGTHGKFFVLIPCFIFFLAAPLLNRRKAAPEISLEGRPA
ncbi:MAG TPA: HTTM domain-containing protein [Pseudobdellovibrionaceae bacterium]|nr:HTTM domain-containing protein [Pseudobdellovibrionaceae bacterium]